MLKYPHCHRKSHMSGMLNVLAVILMMTTSFPLP